MIDWWVCPYGMPVCACVCVCIIWCVFCYLVWVVVLSYVVCSICVFVYPSTLWIYYVSSILIVCFLLFIHFLWFCILVFVSMPACPIYWFIFLYLYYFIFLFLDLGLFVIRIVSMVRCFICLLLCWCYIIDCY